MRAFSAIEAVVLRASTVTAAEPATEARAAAAPPTATVWMFSKATAVTARPLIALVCGTPDADCVPVGASSPAPLPLASTTAPAPT